MTVFAPTVPSATNRAVDPSLETGAQSSKDATLYVAAVDAGFKHSGASSWHITRTTKNPGSNTIANFWCSPNTAADPACIPVVPGELISVGTMVRCMLAGFRGRMEVTYRDAGNALLTNAVGAINGAPSSADWAIIRYQNITVPALAAWAAVSVTVLMPLNITTVGGETCWVDSLMVNAGNLTETRYFDGNTPGCHWLGAPNLSASVRPELGPWRLWNGLGEYPLDEAGVWDGASLDTTPLATVELAV